MPNEDASIEIKVKATYKGEVFDDRTVNYIGGAGIIEGIPYGYVLDFLKLQMFFFVPSSSVEQACFRMINNEVCRLYLSGAATKGVERFGIPSGEPVVYEVTMGKFEKVGKFQFF